MTRWRRREEKTTGRTDPAVTLPRPPGRDHTRLLFTPGGRLGWTFRDRRTLMAPYAEPPPDPGLIRQQAAARAAAASRAYENARTWVLRPSLMLAVLVAVLAGCAKAVSPGTRTGEVLIAALLL